MITKLKYIMSSTGVASMFTTYKKFEPSKVSYGNVKANSNGKGKTVPILYDGKPLRVQTPLTFNWGANELVDERIKNISQREGRPVHYTDDEFKIRKKYKWFLICKKVIEELE